MEEEKKEQKVDIKKAAITGGLISGAVFIIYRMGVKRGYKDAMGIIEASLDCIADTFTMSTF